MKLAQISKRARVELIAAFTPVVEANDEVQEWISENGKDLPEDFLKLCSNLDFAIKEM